MTVYVDPLAKFGWKLRGRETASCHLFTDDIDLQSLHDLAQKIGMKRAWFQDKAAAPHYDLTPSRRQAAVVAGAVELDRKEAVGVWRARRAALASNRQLNHQPKL